jgi:hypothetical protein
MENVIDPTREREDSIHDSDEEYEVEGGERESANNGSDDDTPTSAKLLSLLGADEASTLTGEQAESKGGAAKYERHNFRHLKRPPFTSPSRSTLESDRNQAVSREEFISMAEHFESMQERSMDQVQSMMSQMQASIMEQMRSMSFQKPNSGKDAGAANAARKSDERRGASLAGGATSNNSKIGERGSKIVSINPTPDARTMLLNKFKAAIPKAPLGPLTMIKYAGTPVTKDNGPKTPVWPSDPTHAAVNIFIRKWVYYTNHGGQSQLTVQLGEATKMLTELLGDEKWRKHAWTLDDFTEQEIIFLLWNRFKDNAATDLTESIHLVPMLVIKAHRDVAISFAEFKTACDVIIQDNDEGGYMTEEAISIALRGRIGMPKVKQQVTQLDLKTTDTLFEYLRTVCFNIDAAAKIIKDAINISEQALLFTAKTPLSKESYVKKVKQATTSLESSPRHQ